MRYVIADSSLFNLPNDHTKNYRGMNVFTLSELRGITGKTKSGDFMTGHIQQPMFTLAPEERMGIMQTSAYVQAVVSSRMNRISSLEWDIIHKKDLEDEIYYKAKELKQIHDEFNDLTSMRDLTLRYRIRLTLQQELPDLKDDLSNFTTAMLRYKKRFERKVLHDKEEIKTWIENSNLEDDFSDFIKKYVEALMIHGATSVYKEFNQDNLLENFYILPGGTVYPLRSVQVGSYVAYAQVIVGYMPKIYFQDEISFVNYLPSSCRSYGFVPLDALVNKVAEQLLFDQFAAERADGTKEPEKLIVLGDNRSLFPGDFTSNLSLPMNSDEQKRLEEKINTSRKGAIMTLSGIGHPVVEDISKADTFPQQSDRQDKLLRDIALVFNMTNMEINLAGGEFTSGKETSETQSEIEEGKGTRPIIQKIESIINKSILPFRFGTDYKFQYKKGLSDYEQVKLDSMKAQSGTYTLNEIRQERGSDPIFEEGNDSLQSQQQAPGQSPFSPVNMRAVE
jgi:hypothetical protein